MWGRDESVIGNLKCLGSVQGSLMRVKVDYNASGLSGSGGATGFTRGRISTFSRSSRKRLLETFATLDHETVVESGTGFLTLTYGQSWPDPARAKQHLEAFLKRIARSPSCPDPAFVWKMEPQERGAPHFHVVIFGWEKTRSGWPLTKFQIADMWASVIGHEYLDWSDPEEPRSPFTRIEYIRSWRRLIGYVSKYMAKTDEQKESVTPPTPDTAASRGERASASPAAESRSGFNYSAYLATDGTEVEYIGRSWGIVGRANLPKAEIRLIAFEADGSFEEFHSLVRYKWARINPADRGFTVFSTLANVWFDTLIDFLGVNLFGDCPDLVWRSANAA